ncbi:hypothetical protein KC353_g73 [Hortaea werneckii]|nr:hypothetical protein KC353_g73 [Hortaea werneckii]
MRVWILFTVGPVVTGRYQNQTLGAALGGREGRCGAIWAHLVDGTRRYPRRGSEALQPTLSQAETLETAFWARISLAELPLAQEVQKSALALSLYRAVSAAFGQMLLVRLYLVRIHMTGLDTSCTDCCDDRASSSETCSTVAKV